MTAGHVVFIFVFGIPAALLVWSLSFWALASIWREIFRKTR